MTMLGPIHRETMVTIFEARRGISASIVERRGSAGFRVSTAIIAALAAALLAACAGAPPKPTSVNGSIVAAKELNPSVSNRPSPMLLRIYELRSPTAFNQAVFMSLYQDDRAALAADLVAREEFTLQPGQTLPYRKQLSLETRYLGVVGLYRDLEHSTWRAVTAVQTGKTQALTIRADALALSFASSP